MNWVFLSLLAPLFWASSSFVDKYILHKYTDGVFDFLFFSTITSWVFAFLIVLIIGIPELSWYSCIPVITGIILIYSYGFYAKALERGETSSLVVLYKLIPVVTAALAFFFLGQRLSLTQVLGFVVVLVGAIIVSFQTRKKILLNGFWMVLIAIFLWSILTLLIDYGLTKMSFWDYFLLDNVGSALAGLTLFLFSSMRKQVIRGIVGAGIPKIAWFSWNNLLDFFGQMSIKQALAIAPSAGLVTVVMQVQSFYAILIGALLTALVPHIIKEDISARTLQKKCIGAAVMFFGIYLLVR